MKKALVFFCAVFGAALAGAETLTISECYKLARENYPMIKQFGLVREAEKYDLENATSGYLPQFSISSNAMYLSGSPDIMGTSILPKDQYRAQIGATQVIWDGGNISANKRIARARAKAEIEKNEVILYELNDRVNRVFFGILLQGESLRRNAIHQKDIEDAIASVEAMIANGTANEYDLSLLKVELMNAKQKEIEIKSLRSAYMKMLSFLINRQIDESTVFERPKSIENLKSEILRPEMEYYAASEDLLESERDSVDAGLMPKISLFGYAGYGKSSFVSLSESKFYGLGGVSFSWSFGNFYTEQNEKLKIDTGKKMVRAQAEEFLFKTRLKMIQEDGEIKKMQELIKRDDEIVRLRNSIVDMARERMKNGTITTTDFIKELNAKELSEQTRISHSIEKLSREYSYKYLTNN
ncbi:MAG: TolC family protein [Opitutales bacterium]|nr:TolC family protein [Opitutales bacterium]